MASFLQHRLRGDSERMLAEAVTRDMVKAEQNETRLLLSSRVRSFDRHRTWNFQTNEVCSFRSPITRGTFRASSASFSENSNSDAFNVDVSDHGRHGSSKALTVSRPSR